MGKEIDILKLTAKELHGMGEDLREQDKHEEAIQYLSVAIVKYQKEDDYRGMIDALKGRTLTWKHYFLLTEDKTYAILALKDAEAMLEITQEKKLDDKLSTSYFRLGEVAMLTDDFPPAIKYYEDSLTYYVGPESEKGDFRYHLGEAVYRNGDKNKGKQIMLQGVKEIQDNANEVDSFLIHVWESGAHMRLAFCLREEEPEVARKHLDIARKIAEDDEKLIIRRRQIEELAEGIEE